MAEASMLLNESKSQAFFIVSIFKKILRNKKLKVKIIPDHSSLFPRKQVSLFLSALSLEIHPLQIQEKPKKLIQ